MRAALVLLLIVIAAPGALALPPGDDPELARVAEWMTGSFDTFAQVDEDEARGAEYTHLRAVMHIVPVKIPGLSEKGRTLYVEQAAARAEDRPYRQRVYLLTRRDGQLVNRIFRIRDAERYVGAHRDPGRLVALTDDALELSEGCDLVWTRKNEGLYTGVAGAGGTCPNTLRDATHAVSYVEMTPTAITSLDQGFDDEGAHRWGPPPGVVGHVFVKREAAKR